MTDSLPRRTQKLTKSAASLSLSTQTHCRSLPMHVLRQECLTQRLRVVISLSVRVTSVWTLSQRLSAWCLTALWGCVTLGRRSRRAKMRSSVTALLAAAASAALLLGCASSERVRVESTRLIPEQLVTLG